MLLYNTMSAPQRARLIEEAGEERITLSFYKYYRIEDPAGLRDRLFVDWTQFDVLCRIYVASE